MDLFTVFGKVALALGLGLLVGMQRERVQSPLAGIRTFALITVLGAVCALAGESLGGWIVGMGGIAVAALLVAGNLAQPAAKETDPGLTTEVAALVMYALGAYLVVGHAVVAITLSGATALVLHWKTPMHAFVNRIGEADFKAIMQFVLISLVILPVLPDQTYDPFEVLNPRRIWLMVVLIVGISLGGYVAYKWLGPQAGTVLGGVLGGLISSTATTVSYARRTREAPNAIRLAALVLMIASTIAVIRVLVEIAVVAPASFIYLAPPLAVVGAWQALLAAGVYRMARGERDEVPASANPAELKSALIFGGLYAIVLFAVAAAKHALGDAGLYAIAVLSGLHDLDAITLSTAQLVDQGQVATDTGWRLIVVAIISNLFFKGLLVAILGHRRLLRWMVILFAASAAGGLLVLAMWGMVAF